MSFQLSLLKEVLQTVLHFTSNDVLQYAQNAANKRSSSEPLCSGFLLRVGHIGMEHPND